MVKNQFYIAASFSRNLASLAAQDAFDPAKKVQAMVSLDEVAPILENDFPSMNHRTIIDENNRARFDFVVDGTDLEGQPLLSVTFTGPGFQFKFSNCRAK